MEIACHLPGFQRGNDRITIIGQSIVVSNPGKVYIRGSGNTAITTTDKPNASRGRRGGQGVGYGDKGVEAGGGGGGGGGSWDRGAGSLERLGAGNRFFIEHSEKMAHNNTVLGL